MTRRINSEEISTGTPSIRSRLGGFAKEISASEKNEEDTKRENFSERSHEFLHHSSMQYGPNTASNTLSLRTITNPLYSAVDVKQTDFRDQRKTQEPFTIKRAIITGIIVIVMGK